MEELSVTGTDPYSLFIYAMKSPVTREKYTRRLVRFFEFLGLEGGTIEEQCRAFAERGKSDSNWAFASIVKYLQFHRQRVERKEITAATLRNHVKTLKLYCEMADIDIHWKKITRGLPRGRKYADDRAPTIDEIKRMIEYPDRRIKAIILTMASSGMRLGGWDFLRWGHVRHIERNGKVVAARLTVYGGDADEYFTFVTPEGYCALSDWMAYREQCGEPINDKSWLMRDLWDVAKPRGTGLISAPKRLKSTGVKRLVERALWAQGIRKKLEPGRKRHEFQADHGLRKWFKTRCEIAGVRPINIEELMSHSTGVSDSYYRATQEELLNDYLKAVDALTIGDEMRLRMQLDEMASQIPSAQEIEERHRREMSEMRQEMEARFKFILERVNVAELK